MGIESAIAGGLISGVGSLVGSSMTNDTNQQIASSNNATAIELANTAHQREVADLKAAGLNPILSAGGNGASVPSLTSPTVTNALGDAMSAGITNYSALQTSRQTDPLIDKMKAEVDNLREASAKMRTEAKLNDALTLKAAADTSSSLSVARNYDADTDSKRSSPFFSKIFGSDWAHSAHDGISGALSSGYDWISGKIKDVISNVNVSSAKKAAPSHSQIYRGSARPPGGGEYLVHSD